LRQIAAKFYDLRAPYGVCKVKMLKTMFFAFFSSKRAKPDKLLRQKKDDAPGRQYAHRLIIREVSLPV
jgi:hypothetical protein